MQAARLIFALQEGAFVLPEGGEIAVYRACASDDLSALPRERVRVLTGFKPDHDHFAARGFRTDPAPPYAAALVCLPRSKDAALALVAQAMAETRGPILIDGQKTDGIDSLLKSARAARLQMGEILSKAHGKCCVLTPLAPPADWLARDHVFDGFVTRPGVFSADGPDAGSALLAAALPEKLPSRMADLGGGWGFLSRAVLSRTGVQSLDLIEAEQDALDCARRNLDDPRLRLHWADATTFKPPHLWDGIVMNPPFHAGRDADPAIGQGFLKAAHRWLTPSGKLWLVANRHLPYLPILKTLFLEIEEIGGSNAFRLILAARPIKHR